MSNNNPNTSGLVSLANRPNNERTTIATQGGIASGKKRRELKRMSEIIHGIRQESEKDPVEIAIRQLFYALNDFSASTKDIIKGLNFINEMETDDKSPAQCTTVYKYITPEEQNEIKEHINAVIGDTLND